MYYLIDWLINLIYLVDLSLLPIQILNFNFSRITILNIYLFSLIIILKILLIDRISVSILAQYHPSSQVISILIQFCFFFSFVSFFLLSSLIIPISFNLMPILIKQIIVKFIRLLIDICCEGLYLYKTFITMIEFKC